MTSSRHWIDGYDLMLALRVCMADGDPSDILPRLKTSRVMRRKVLHQLRNDNWAFRPWKIVRTVTKKETP